MEYKIVVMQAQNFLGTDFTRAAEKLSAEVNREISAGWEPQGGVNVGESRALKLPFLFQAMIKRR